MAVTSMAWASSSSGSSPGSRSASIVLPAAGRTRRGRGGDLPRPRPRARAGLGWPTTSARSGAVAQRRCGTGGSGTGAGTSPGASAAYRLTSSSRVSTGCTRTPETSRASAALASGTTTWRTPFRAAARTSGSTPGTGRTVPVEPQLADVDDVPDDVGGDRLARDECGDADGEVEAGADLRDRRRREVDDDAAQGNRVPEFAAAALTRSGAWAHAPSGQPPDAEQRQPGGDVHLDVDEEADDPPAAPPARYGRGSRDRSDDVLDPSTVRGGVAGRRRRPPGCRRRR